MIYAITPKGLLVLRSAARFGLSSHLRELLAFCDPAMRVEQARAFFPPESLQLALYALQQLELIDGPPVDQPRARAPWTARVSPAAGTAPGAPRA
jgi:hypothetical protein